MTDCFQKKKVILRTNPNVSLSMMQQEKMPQFETEAKGEPLLAKGGTRSSGEEPQVSVTFLEKPPLISMILLIICL